MRDTLDAGLGRCRLAQLELLTPRFQADPTDLLTPRFGADPTDLLAPRFGADPTDLLTPRFGADPTDLLTPRFGADPTELLKPLLGLRMVGALLEAQTGRETISKSLNGLPAVMGLRPI